MAPDLALALVNSPSFHKLQEDRRFIWMGTLYYFKNPKQHLVNDMIDTIRNLYQEEIESEDFDFPLSTNKQIRVDYAKIARKKDSIKPFYSSFKKSTDCVALFPASS